MKYKYKGKLRNSGKRKRKRIVLIGTEGKNKTEVNYFSGFSSKESKIKFARGNETDPVKIAKHICDDYDYYELDKELGDLAFCVVDGDVSKEKEKQIIKAESLMKKIGKVIVSNPCIEVWFLCHFTSSTKEYNSSNEVIKRLKEYIPEYSKNLGNIYTLLKDKTKTAINNAKHLEVYNYDNNRLIHKSNNQPSTEVYKIIEIFV